MKLKKLDNEGFGHIEILLVAVFIAIIGGIGVFLFQHNKNNVSHAGSYTQLGVSSGITVSACKTYSPLGGGTYTGTVLLTKLASTPAYYHQIGADKVNPFTFISGDLNVPFGSNKYFNDTSSTFKYSVPAKNHAVLIGIWVVSKNPKTSKTYEHYAYGINYHIHNSPGLLGNYYWSWDQISNC